MNSAQQEIHAAAAILLQLKSHKTEEERQHNASQESTAIIWKKWAPELYKLSEFVLKAKSNIDKIFYTSMYQRAVHMYHGELTKALGPDTNTQTHHASI